MRLLKVVLGASVSVLVVSASNVARADDPRNGAWFQLQYQFYDLYNDNSLGLSPGQSIPQCVGPWGGVPNNGTKLISWGCNSSTAAADQAWFFDLSDCFTLTDESTGQQSQACSIRNAKNVYKCLGIAAGSQNEGANAITWDCLGKTHHDQYWFFEPTSDGRWQMWNYNMFTKGLGPVGGESWTGSCPPGFPWGDCEYEVDRLGLTTNLSSFLVTYVTP